MKYQGSCHCGAVKWEFEQPGITSAVRCNCSICQRKGALMSGFTLAPDELKITASEDVLRKYQFGSHIAEHYFCGNCGIYTFHATFRKPGHFRVNLGCIDDLDMNKVEVSFFDGKSL